MGALNKCHQASTKKKDIHSGWSEIVRTMNTQKEVTTIAQSDKDEMIQIRRCSEANQKVQNDTMLKIEISTLCKEKICSPQI